MKITALDPRKVRSTTTTTAPSVTTLSRKKMGTVVGGVSPGLSRLYSIFG
ncbi:MAG: hypothetical protein H6706_10815 [Myxococcales bacterium]|nr:hypothetical protein [Myxococcales bacterium]